MKSFILSALIILFFSCSGSPLFKNNSSTTLIDSIGLDKDSLQCQLLWFAGCSYQLCETQGWIANPDSTPINSGDSRILVIYKPDKNILHNKFIQIYSNVILKELYSDSGISISKFLAGERKMALDNGENVSDTISIITRDNKTAIVKNYTIERSGEYFSIAYIDEPEHIIMITLSCKDLEDFTHYFSAFKTIVQSYQYKGTYVVNQR